MARKFRSDDTSLWSYRFGSGADGAKTVSSDSDYDGANASCTGTSGTTALTLGAASTFANGDLILIHQSRGTGAGEYELNKIVSGGGGTSITLELPLQNTYGTGAQALELKEYSAVTVNSTKTWSAPAWDGSKGGILACLCTGTITVTGTISGVGKGYRGGAGSTTDSTTSTQGEGTSGAGGVSTSANGNGGGGSHKQSGSQAGGSGGGGHSSAGGTGTTVGSSTGGTGGSTAGNAELTTMVFGGGSGGGGGNGGIVNGVAAGGIVFLIGKNITVGGAINVSGSNGSNGSADSASTGGSAGGSVLLKGHNITLGSSLVTSASSSGGSFSGRTGGAGSAGRIHADYLASISGTTSPTIDSRQDFALADYGGMFLFGLL